MIATAPFGRTGHESSRVIFGAAGLWSKKWGQDWANALLDEVVGRGVNHIDTAANYGDSELLLAPWLAASTDGVRNRDRVYLATKTDKRRGDAARADLEKSLERLGQESVDLIQLHNLVEEDEWEQAHGPGGVVEAMVQARDEGLVSHIGVTGHGARIAGMHLRSLDAFDFDSVLLPWNHTMLDRPDYRSDAEALREVCADRNVAMQTIKSIARRRWPEGGVDDVDKRRSWYQPLRDGDAIERAMRFVLANGQLFLNTSSDTRLMGEMLAAAERIFNGDEVDAPGQDALEADVRDFGMSALFDGADLERI